MAKLRQWIFLIGCGCYLEAALDMKLKFGLFMFILLFGWPKIIIWVLSDEFFEFLFFTVDLMRDGERLKVSHLCDCVCV